MEYFFQHSQKDWEALLADRGFSKVHGQKLIRRIFRDLNREPWLEPYLPREFSAELLTRYKLDTAEIEQVHISRYDGAAKFLVRLLDGSLVESVLMPETGRVTLCLSSQVGCAQACVFCHTGRMGLKRQLSAAEIVGQVMMARYWMQQNPDWMLQNQQPNDAKISNIVFMGMGEPLDNVEEVLKAIRIVTEPSGLSLSLKRVSVSTAGQLPGIKRFFEAYPTGTLALSLHATNDRDRSRIMPINRKWPIREVLSYLRQHYSQAHRRGHLLVQYTLIAGVNDQDEHAKELYELLQGIPVKVNLIPLNPVAPSRLEAPDASYVERFRDVLHKAGVRVMIRYSKGQDIAAACGQLVTEAPNRASHG